MTERVTRRRFLQLVGVAGAATLVPFDVPEAVANAPIETLPLVVAPALPNGTRFFVRSRSLLCTTELLVLSLELLSLDRRPRLRINMEMIAARETMVEIGDILFLDVERTKENFAARPAERQHGAEAVDMRKRGGELLSGITSLCMTTEYDFDEYQSLFDNQVRRYQR